MPGSWPGRWPATATTGISQRTLFDSVAQLYEASRLGYPSTIVELAVTTAGLGAGSAVLEVGCGTGQLTERLARFGFRLMAIDLGPSMINAARRRLDGSAVLFEVASFEDFAVPDLGNDPLHPAEMIDVARSPSSHGPVLRSGETPQTQPAHFTPGATTTPYAAEADIHPEDGDV